MLIKCFNAVLEQENVIQKYIPCFRLRENIKDASMSDLRDFLENIRKYSPKIGEVAMRHVSIKFVFLLDIFIYIMLLVKIIVLSHRIVQYNILYYIYVYILSIFTKINTYQL